MRQSVSNRCLGCDDRISRILRWTFRIHKGEEIVPVIKDEETLFRVTDAAIQFFDDNANPSERFQFTIERVGEDKFEKVIKEAYNG